MNPLMKYPVFVTDQVLTADSLNELVAYLNTQNLSTRRNLIGTGVAFGLEVNSDLKTYVHLSCGCGVTSMGYLINIPEQQLIYYRGFTDQGSTPYPPFFKNDGTQYDLWEMLTETEFLEADDPVNDKLIDGNTAFDLKDLAVMLYLELIDKDLDNCIDEGCDDKGIARLFNLRKLLVRKSDLIKIIRKEVNGTAATVPLSESEVFQKLRPACNLDMVKAHRLNFNLSDLTSLNLAQINSLSKLKTAFKEILLKDVVKISGALFQSYELYKDELVSLYPAGNPFTGYDSNSPAINPLYVKLKNEVTVDELNIQYAYDFLCDLVKAYEEFTQTATDYRAKCCMNPDQFPLHLMLGVTTKQKKSDYIYRHHWQPSPAVSNMKSLLEELRFNHYKLYQLIVHFHLHSFSDPDDIRITPGKYSTHPFSAQSIPHYYSNGVNGEIHKHWNYHLSKACGEDSVLSYFPSLYSSKPFVLRPLLYSLRDYEFFRIEGHIGQEYGSVRNRIRELIRDYNLPLDVLGVKLSTDHLDVEVDDHCFMDLQTTYKCNRDEYLACTSVLSKLMDDFMVKINIVVAANKNLLYKPATGFSQLPFITHFRHLYYVLNIYTIYLRVIQQQLPEHIKDFKYPQFRISYFIVYAFTLICQIMLEYISNLVKTLSVPFLQFMLLKSLFERMIDDCMDAKFRSLYDMYRERLLKLQLGRLFPGYVDGSPGMEHIGGVKEGGTFILVYDEMPAPPPGTPVRPEPPTAEDPCTEDDESKKVSLNVLQYAYVLTREAVLIEEFKDDLIADNIDNLFVREKPVSDPLKAEAKVAYTESRVKELQAQYPSQKEFLGFLFKPVDEPDVTPKTYRVVADFAIPFRCCPSCLQVDELPEQVISFKLDPTEFCFGDPKKYEIQAEPKGGTLESSCGGIEPSGDSFLFVPSNIDCEEEDITLTYVLGEQQAELQVKVYNPEAGFSISYEEDTEGKHLLCTNESRKAETYEWTVSSQQGDVLETSTEEHLKFYYAGIHHEVVQISLNAIKGTCSDVFTRRDVKTPQDEVEVSLSLPKVLFCSNEDRAFPFTLNPTTGGVLEPAGEFSQVGNNPPTFNPSKASSGEITFTYTFQGKTASLTIKNIKISASFEEADRDARTIRLSSTDPADNYQWKVDGADHGNERETIIFIEKHPGKESVIVSLAVSVANCRDFSEKEVLLHKQEPGVIVPEHFGKVLLPELRGNAIYSRLPEYHYTAGDQLIEFHTKLVTLIDTDDALREAFVAGKSNLEIASIYAETMGTTVETAFKAKDKADEEMAGFLTTFYIGELQQLVATVAALEKDPSKNSNLYKTLASSESQIAALKEIGIDINPGNALKVLIEKSLPQLVERRNSTDILKNIGQIL